MSAGGIPVQPYIILGGFLPEGQTGFPSNPEYSNSDSIVMTFIVDNYDPNAAEKNDLRYLSARGHSFMTSRRWGG